MTRDWDKHIGNILASLDGDDTLDREDKAIQAVLIVLHRAVQGRFSLIDLAILCIDYDGSHATAEARP